MGAIEGEYVRIFALTPGALLGKDLNCAAAPASCNPELTKEGPYLASFHPL